ncbi:MAG TPA: lysylphosphatidylglycerol synthase transmembrane domain-containing protein [Terriglobia bacterium]|nr:lysylphosphatidylglycerol synthase transmembrane domain-containing protein [Terriglobia bacterium]
MKKKALRRWIWLGVSTAVLALIIFNLRHNPEWRHFDWGRLWASLVSAKPGLLLASLAGVYVTYLIRALRWGYLMHPIKKGSLWVLLVGQLLGFSSIYLVGRPGEFVRPAYIARKESLPISSMVAVWLMERICDTICLVVLFSVVLYFAPVEMSAAGKNVLSVMHKAGDAMLVVTLILVVGLVVYRLKTQAVMDWALRMARFLPRSFQRHVEHFLHSFAEGLKVVRSLPDFVGSVALSVALWITNATVFWLTLRSLGGSLGDFVWLASALVLFCASLGLVVQFPGIGGGYQVGIILALTEIFGIGADVSTGAAILLWLMMSVPVLLVSLGLLVREGLSFRRLEAITEEEEMEKEAATKEAE